MKTWMTTVLLGMCLAAPARAAETVPPPEPPKEEVEPPKDEVRSDKAARLAEEYGVTKKEIVDLRDKGLGWGGIKHALDIARKAGVPLADVMKLRDSGMGWGQIAKSYGFKLGDVTGKTHAPGVRPGERGDHEKGPRGPGDKGGAGLGGGNRGFHGGRPR